MGRWKRIEEHLAAKLLEELRACAAYFNRAAIIARDLKVLRSLSFRSFRKFTCCLYVAFHRGSGHALGQQLSPCPAFGIAGHRLLKLVFVRVRKTLVLWTA